MKVLLIEDDIPLNTTITNFLRSSNNEVKNSFDGEDAIELIEKESFELYIIDINIPHIDGLELLRYIRQKDTTSPVIIITASLELANFLDAFELGCSEYIKKPFFLEELQLRIEKLFAKKTPNIVSISNDIGYDMEHEELSVHGKTVRLRKKERRLLTLLLQNINHTVTTQEIENYVWENDIKESYPLRQLVSDLRKKLVDGERFIVAEKGIGYRFETLT